MPFQGDDVSFFALLPEGSNGLEETVNRLTLDTLRNAMANTFPLTVDVGIPKFRMEQTLSLRNVRMKCLIPFDILDLFISIVVFYRRFVTYFIVFVLFFLGFGQDGFDRHVRFIVGRFFRF
jgi:hypothetical protein